jgi:hypothetical protein
LNDKEEKLTVMKFGVGPLRPRLISFGITCFVLLTCWSAAAGNTCAGGATRGTRLGREFKLRAGQQVTLKGQSLRIRFAEVKEDSRCPADVTCVWAGNAAVLLEVSIRGRGSKSLTLNTNSRSSLVDENPYRGYKVKLVELNPYPRSNRSIAAGDYIVTLLVSKN